MIAEATSGTLPHPYCYVNLFARHYTSLSRRTFLLGLGGGVGGGGVTALITAAGARGQAIGDTLRNDPHFVAGPIESLDAPSALRIRTRRAPVEITLTRDAHIWRDRRSTLESFAVDEEVVAEGEWRGDAFVASILTSMYFALQGRLVETGPTHLRTTAWVAELVPESRVQRGTELLLVGAASLRTGQRINVLARRDVRRDVFVALRIYDQE